MSSVQAIRPYDTSEVRDRGMKALVLLASSLGWNVLHKSNQALRLTARNGVQINVPDNTSVKASVFQAMLSKIMTYSTEQTPTIELVDRIIAITKPNQDQENRLRMALGESPQQHRQRMNNDRPAEPRSDAPLVQFLEIPDFEVVEEPPPVEAPTQPVGSEPMATVLVDKLIVKTQPRMSKRGTTHSPRPHPLAIERHWSDGSVDFKCKFCSYHSDNIVSFNGHGRLHPLATRPGELNNEQKRSMRERELAAEIKAAIEADVAIVEPEPEPEPEPDPEGENATRLQALHDPAWEMVRQIQQIVSPEIEEAYKLLEDDFENLRTENINLRAELKRLTEEWDALQDLINGRNKT